MSKYSEFNGHQDDILGQDLMDDTVPMDQSDTPAENVGLSIKSRIYIVWDVEAMKRRVKEMEEEVSRLKNLQSELDKDFEAPSTEEEKAEIDSRSIYVGNVDYSVTPEMLQEHFKSCGTINRVTILCNKFNGSPKGYAYIEFSDPSLVANALVLNESVLVNRPLKVFAKRTNIPGVLRGGFSRGSSRSHYRGGYGRRARGGYRGRRGHYTPY
ncbi:hypothetical protein DSO57_1015153 [Entomophthora muscae]|uniref:Uncharacterized protein n=1 Tax=Entomophthora muscae TaxID=34485 RepID=A0ACC2UQW6_9FUNG|nr:hypothetical protein DSO57_1015153 [Entomophthora muscae]